MIFRVARRNRWLVRGWAIGVVTAILCAVVNLFAAFENFLPVLTGVMGLLSGAIGVSVIRLVKASAEDADVFGLLAFRIQDPHTSEKDRQAACRRAWDYIDNRLKQSKA